MAAGAITGHEYAYPRVRSLDTVRRHITTTLMDGLLGSERAKHTPIPEVVKAVETAESIGHVAIEATEALQKPGGEAWALYAAGLAEMPEVPVAQNMPEAA